MEGGEQGESRMRGTEKKQEMLIVVGLKNVPISGVPDHTRNHKDCSGKSESACDAWWWVWRSADVDDDACKSTRPGIHELSICKKPHQLFINTDRKIIEIWEWWFTKWTRNGLGAVFLVICLLSVVSSQIHVKCIVPVQSSEKNSLLFIFLFILLSN